MNKFHTQFFHRKYYFMQNMPRLTISERNQIIGMLKTNDNFPIISSIFNCSVKSIRRIKSKYGQHGSVEDLPRSRRPSVTTERETRRIVRSHKRNRFLVAAETSRGE